MIFRITCSSCAVAGLAGEQPEQASRKSRALAQAAAQRARQPCDWDAEARAERHALQRGSERTVGAPFGRALVRRRSREHRFGHRYLASDAPQTSFVGS